MVSRENSGPEPSMAMEAADAAILSAVSVFAAPLSLLAAPFAALYLHKERLDRYWVASVAIGLTVAVSFVAVLFGIASAAGLLRSDGEAGGIAALFAGALLLGAVFIVVDVDAIRDLASGRRAHVTLDVVRLIATVIMVAGVAAVIIIQRNDPASQIGDAGPFSVLSAVCAGAGMLMASGIRSRWKGRAGPSNKGIEQNAAS